MYYQDLIIITFIFMIEKLQQIPFYKLISQRLKPKRLEEIRERINQLLKLVNRVEKLM